VTSKIDLRQVRDSNKYILDGFSEKIESYFETTEFDEYLDYLNLSINIQFIVESISKNGNDIVVSTQIYISNNVDQHYYTKGADISYSPGKSLNHSQIFDSISSLLDYYAYLFIANELDTYSYLGGNLFFNKCLDITNEGLQSNFSRGWDNRKRKCSKIKEKIDLRGLRYNFFLAFDELNKKNPKKTIMVDSMNKFYESLINIELNYGKDRSSIQFLSAYCNEIGRICKKINLNDILIFLASFDENNKKIYNLYLD
tara:strand:+ start:72 stop:839 length:768 start_codon:yes stop_codon:yes gene_type:complete